MSISLIDVDDNGVLKQHSFSPDLHLNIVNYPTAKDDTVLPISL